MDVGRRRKLCQKASPNATALPGGTGRVAAAELVGNQCGACRVELDRVAFNAARAAPVDTVVRCENCGAILVRN